MRCKFCGKSINVPTIFLNVDERSGCLVAFESFPGFYKETCSEACAWKECARHTDGRHYFTRAYSRRLRCSACGFFDPSDRACADSACFAHDGEACARGFMLSADCPARGAS